MRKKLNTNKPVKAYKNVDFLISPDARTIRILSEFLEPMRRFRMNGIKDTIVFFGSARVRPRREVLQILRSLKQKARREGLSRSLKRKLDEATIDYEMSRYYEDAVVLSRLLTKWSLSLVDGHRFVICSGGGPGIMEAANKGAFLAGGKSIGLNISLPSEQYSNHYITPELNEEFHYFFMRKFWFAYLAKALVIFPGGYGTLDELFEMLTLLQTKKIRKKMSIVIYGTEYWNKVLNFEEMVRHHAISRRDLRLLKFCDNPQEAFEYLKTELTKNYLSGEVQADNVES